MPRVCSVCRKTGSTVPIKVMRWNRRSGSDETVDGWVHVHCLPTLDIRTEQRPERLRVAA